MSNETKMPSHHTPKWKLWAGIAAGVAAGLLLLLIAFGLGLRLAGSGGEGAVPADDVRGAEAAPAEGQAMEGMAMEGMDMGGDGTVRLAPSTADALGLVTVPAEIASLRRAIRSTGHVTYDETRLTTVSPRFSGWIEELHVDFTGRAVTAGEPLLEVYSPELVSAQEELLAARRLQDGLQSSVAPGAGTRTADLVEAARRRLLLWGISAEQIERLEATGDVRRTLTLHAPVGGFVVEKGAEAGASVGAGSVLFRLADLSTVWLDVEVYERDLRLVRLGDEVDVRIDAYPGEPLTGRISYVYPEVERDTRTARVRVDLPNPGGRVKPGMFATAHLDALVAERAVLVPRDAVMHTGRRDLVFVEIEPGSYEPREVEVGATAGQRTQILRGLLAGERVVARANFILDAESRLMETMMGQPAMPGMEMEMEMDVNPSHEH